MNAEREKPSSKARARGYAAMRHLFDLFDKLDLFYPYREEEDDLTGQVDYKGWKDWCNRYTPPDKRGGPTNPPRKRKKR